MKPHCRDDIRSLGRGRRGFTLASNKGAAVVPTEPVIRDAHLSACSGKEVHMPVRLHPIRVVLAVLVVAALPHHTAAQVRDTTADRQRTAAGRPLGYSIPVSVRRRRSGREVHWRS